MDKHINTLFTLIVLCFVLLVGGCGSDSKHVTVIERAIVNNTEAATILKDAQLPIVKDFRKDLHSGTTGAKIVRAKAVSYTSSFMNGGMVIFTAVIEIHGQQHCATVLINTHWITHGKNSDGPFVNAPQPGESIQVIFLNGTYYGPVSNLGLD